MSVASLFVYRERPGSLYFVLGWSTDDGRTYTPETRGIGFFRTEAEARAYGLSRFGEIVRKRTHDPKMRILSD